MLTQKEIHVIVESVTPIVKHTLEMNDGLFGEAEFFAEVSEFLWDEGQGATTVKEGVIAVLNEFIGD